MGDITKYYQISPGGIMNRGEKNQQKKIVLRVRIEGRKKPVTKEALVCCKSKKIIKFL
jgi:hypothetical protein